MQVQMLNLKFGQKRSPWRCWITLGAVANLGTLMFESVYFVKPLSTGTQEVPQVHVQFVGIVAQAQTIIEDFLDEWGA